MPSNLPPGYQIEGAPQQPSSGYRVEPMVTPAEQRAREEAAYRRDQDAIQRDRQEASDRRAEEQLRLTREGAARAEAAATREARAADPSTPRASPDLRGRLEFGLPPATRARQRLSQMERSGYSLNDDWGAALIDAIPDWNLLEPVARAAGGEDYQRYDQAAASIEAALLPVFSGMAVTESEAKRFIKANQPQLGDGPGRLREKATNIMEVLNAGSRLAGRPMPFPEVGLYGVPGAEPVQQDRPGPGANISIGGPPGPSGPNVMAPTPSTAPRPGGPTGGDQGWQSIPMRELTAGDETFSVDRTRRVPADSPLPPGAVQVGPNEWVVPPSAPPADPMAGQDPEASAAVDELIADNGGEGQHAGSAALSSGATYGFADELAARIAQAGVAAKNLVTDGEDDYTAQEYHDAYLARSRDISARFRESHPVSTGALEIAGGAAAPGMAQAGRWAVGTEQAAKGLKGLMTSSRVVPQMARGAAVGAAAGAVYGAGNAEGGLEERAVGARDGAVTGAAVGAAIPPMARVAGAAGAMVEPVARPAANLVRRMTGGKPIERPERFAGMMARGRSPDDMARSVDEIRSYGGEPVLADVVGSRGQGTVRAAASRADAGRIRAEEFAAERRVGSQDFVAGLGQRVSPVEQTPQQLDEALGAMQSALSNPEFAAVRGQVYQPDERAYTAFRLPKGREALRDAASTFANSMDDAERTYGDELLRFAEAVDAGQTPQLSIGAADLASRFLLQDARKLALREGGDNMARLLSQIGKAIRDDARVAVPEYGAALDAYAGRAALGDAVEVGERFVGNKGYSGDFVSAVGGMNDAERGVVRAAGRAGLERQASTPAGAAGALDALANGRGQGQRSAALMGPSAANDLQRGAQVGRDLLMTGRNVNPRQGSETALNAVDQVGLSAAGRGIGGALTGNPRQVMGAVVDWFRSRGMNDETAEEIVRLALDPNRVDEAIARLRTRVSEQEAHSIVGEIAAAASPAIAGQAGAGQARPERPRVRMVQP